MKEKQDLIRAKLQEILAGPPRMTQRALADKIGITYVILNHFLIGRDHTYRTTHKTTLRRALRPVLEYLKAEHNWPPSFDAKEAYRKLGSKARRVKSLTPREAFISRLDEGFVVTSIDFDVIKAEDADDSTVIYRPESGVNQEDYEALSLYLIPEDREVLARWVLANILVQRGLMVSDADRLAMNDRFVGLDLGMIEEKGWDRLADEVQEAARSKLE